MPGNFNDFVYAAPNAEPRMPVMHSTIKRNLNKIREANRLVPTPCKYYEKDLLYFFYGRPAYRLSDSVSTNISGWWPVCFVIDANAVTTIERVLPLDSGAFHLNLFEKHLSGLKLADFELDPSLESAARVVGRFWGSNERYFWGDEFQPLDIGQLHDEAEAYQSLLSASGLEDYDDRRKTVEIQTTEELKLAPEVVKAIVVPLRYLRDPDAREALKQWPEAEVLTYRTATPTPRNATELIFQEVYTYLKKHGLV